MPNLKLMNKNGHMIKIYRVSNEKPYQSVSFDLAGMHEYAFYLMVGDVRVESNNQDYDVKELFSASRNGILDRPSPAYFMLACDDFLVTVHSNSISFDMIVVETKSLLPENQAHTYKPGLATILARDVGEGAYRRTVTDMAAIDQESLIHIGETFSGNNQESGCWSSWPPHASPEEAKERHAEHEEYFLVVTPTQGILVSNGHYTNGKQDKDKMIRLTNNKFLQVPLGSHPVCFEPSAGASWGWYLWVYRSFLRKTYNTKAHHINTYVR